MSEVEHFMPILMEKEEEGTLSPILAHGGVRFMWIKHNNLYRILSTVNSLRLLICQVLLFYFHCLCLNAKLEKGWRGIRRLILN